MSTLNFKSDNYPEDKNLRPGSTLVNVHEYMYDFYLLSKVYVAIVMPVRIVH